ncbi:MAG: sigma-70 family RNA polymerase sigma factor [Sediminibacterium sp.]|nr:sigma-70 family RNA polymerase sigma factor [Sediminibacterium sp.]
MSHTKAPITDEGFITGLKSGDSLVLRALYKKYYNIVLKLVVNNSGTQEAAEDVYQETIIVLYEAVQKPEFSLNCQLQTFIYSIAKRLWLKQLRKHGHTGLIREDQEEQLADVQTEMQEHLQKEADIEKMNKSLATLGEPCAALLKDFYVYKLSMEAISDKFGYTNADNAKNQKYKCLQRLKKQFFDTNSVEA